MESPQLHFLNLKHAFDTKKLFYIRIGFHLLDNDAINFLFRVICIIKHGQTSGHAVVKNISDKLVMY